MHTGTWTCIHTEARKHVHPHAHTQRHINMYTHTHRSTWTCTHTLTEAHEQVHTHTKQTKRTPQWAITSPILDSHKWKHVLKHFLQVLACTWGKVSQHWWMKQRQIYCSLGNLNAPNALKPGIGFPGRFFPRTLPNLQQKTCFKIFIATIFRKPHAGNSS